MKNRKNEAHEKKTGVVPKLRFPEFRGSAGWERNELGQIGYFTGGGTPSKANESFWRGNIPWVSSSDIEEESVHSFGISRYITEKALNDSATKLVPANSILLVSRVGVGKLAITKQTLCTSQDFTNYTPTEGCLEFFAYYLKMRSNLLLSFSQGMAIKGFTKDDISKLNINLPNPAEQQRIADCLSSLDSLISAHTQKLDGLKTYKKGLMQQLFPAKGEKVPKLRFPEFRGKGEWEEVEIGRIGNVSMCKRILKEQTSIDGNIPFYKIGTFGKQADAYINNETYEDYKTRFSYPQKGDILISAAGTIGRLVVFDGTPSYFQDSNIVWIENNEQIVSNQFLYHCYTMVVWSTDTNTIPRLYNDNLRRMKIFSTSKSEQQRIAAFLSSIDNLITAQAQKIESLKVHKKGLMQQLFPAMDEANA